MIDNDDDEDDDNNDNSNSNNNTFCCRCIPVTGKRATAYTWQLDQ